MGNYYFNKIVNLQHLPHADYKIERSNVQSLMLKRWFLQEQRLETIDPIFTSLLDISTLYFSLH